MDDMNKCDIGHIIYVFHELLPNIHKRIFKDFKPNHLFAKEGSEV
jgi:hypothetical protein